MGGVDAGSRNREKAAMSEPRQAGLPETIKMHKLRHSAADNLWRETGNIVHAQQLLRHKSVGTTEAYLHPSMDDLTAAMRSMGDGREPK